MFKVPNFDPKSNANRFTFRVPRRRFWESGSASIPYLQYVPLAVIREGKSAPKAEQFAEIADRIGERRAAKMIRRLNQLEIAALEQAWLEASTVSLGESFASSNLSQVLRRRSEQTSSETDTASTA